MNKPCKLEMNVTGAWRLLATLDAADEDQADDLMNAAEQLAWAVDRHSIPSTMGTRLRIVPTGEQAPLMTWTCENGWRDARTGEPA